MSKFERKKLNGIPVFINDDDKRGVVTVITDEENVDEISNAANSLGISGDIAPSRFGDNNATEPPKISSMSTLGSRYEQIFGHTNFVGDKK